MAMKITAKKSAEGYQVSDERCESCEMPLLSMNGSLMCKVCPALQKLVQMKNEADTQNQGDDARDTTETVDVESSSRYNEIVDKDMNALADSDSALRRTVKVNLREIIINKVCVFLLTIFFSLCHE